MIRELLDIRLRYEVFRHLKDWHYEMSLRPGPAYHEGLARRWQVRQAYERAAWSTRFSAFLTSIGRGA